MLFKKLTLLEISKRYHIDPSDIIYPSIFYTPYLKLTNLKKLLKTEGVYLGSLPTLHKITKIDSNDGEIIGTKTNNIRFSEVLTKRDLARAIIVFSERSRNEKNKELKEYYEKLANLFRQLYNVIKQFEYGKLSFEETEEKIKQILEEFKNTDNILLNTILQEKTRIKLSDIEITI